MAGVLHLSKQGKRPLNFSGTDGLLNFVRPTGREELFQAVHFNQAQAGQEPQH